MALQTDYTNGAQQFLSAVNALNLMGGGDTLWSGNATIALVKTAARALAATAGGSPDLIEKACVGLQAGVWSGQVAETHTATSVATARALVTNTLTDLPSTFTGNLPQ